MATETGRVEELIRAAREANPGDARLAEIADEIPGEDSGEPRTEGFEAAVEDRPERLGPDLLLPAFIASVELMASHASVGYLRGGFADLGLAIQDRIASKVRSSENMLKRSYVTGITDALVEPFSRPSQLASPEARAMRSALVLTNLAKLIPGRAVPSYEIGVALDFTRVRRAARRGHWTDSTPVGPDIFGPLWPWGEPPGWAPAPEEAPTRRPSHRVLVVGQGVFDLPPVVQQASRHLGKALGHAGLGLVTGVFQGVDYLVTEAMQDVVNGRGLDEKYWIDQVIPPEIRVDFRRGRPIFAQGKVEGMETAVGQADAVVLIGGAGPTRELAALARHAGKPVLPLAATGGTAEQIFHETFARWDQQPIATLNIHDYLLLSLPVPTAVDQALKLIDRLLARPATSRAGYAPTPPVSLTADHLALASSCWRAPKWDTQFGHDMYRFDAVLVCPEEWLDRVESVEYFLPPIWPSSSSPKRVHSREDRFKLKELTWADSVTVQAKVRITGQDDVVDLTGLVRRSETGPRL